MDGETSQQARVSILLLCYRMEQTIAEALRGALAQTVPCEIIVSDDASDDRSIEIAAAVVADYKGPHRVLIRRNERNLGLCAHIDAVWPLSGGDICVFMAGDDISYPQRIERLLAVFDSFPDAFAVGSAVDEIDADGRPLRRGARWISSPMGQSDFLHRGRFVTLLGASMAVRRRLLSELPPLRGAVEDNMLSLRATLFGKAYCLREPLLKYRLHGGNLGDWIYARGRSTRAGRRLRYERTARMYREIADDHVRCLQQATGLAPQVRAAGEQIAAMYRIEADAREAMLNLPKSQWFGPIWRGLQHPGLRRKSLERAFKLLVPRTLLGL